MNIAAALALALLSACVCSQPRTVDGEPELGRLFFTPEERIAFEQGRGRKKDQAPQAATTMSINGYVLRMTMKGASEGRPMRFLYRS